MTLDEAWAEAEAALTKRGGDWSITIINRESGDGYFEPHYEAYQAVATLGLAFPEYAQTVKGSTEGDLPAALHALAAALSVTSQAARKAVAG